MRTNTADRQSAYVSVNIAVERSKRLHERRKMAMTTATITDLTPASSGAESTQAKESQPNYEEMLGGSLRIGTEMLEGIIEHVGYPHSDESGFLPNALLIVRHEAVPLMIAVQNAIEGFWLSVRGVEPKERTHHRDEAFRFMNHCGLCTVFCEKTTAAFFTEKTGRLSQTFPARHLEMLRLARAVDARLFNNKKPIEAAVTARVVRFIKDNCK